MTEKHMAGTEGNARKAADASYLAGLMLRWEQMRRSLDEVEKEIEDLVLAIGKTQTVGNVRASYSPGRKTYKYEDAATAYIGTHPEAAEVMLACEQTTYDWKAICADLKLSAPFTWSEPSVTMKVLD